MVPLLLFTLCLSAMADDDFDNNREFDMPPMEWQQHFRDFEITWDNPLTKTEGTLVCRPYSLAMIEFEETEESSEACSCWEVTGNSKPEHVKIFSGSFFDDNCKERLAQVGCERFPKFLDTQNEMQDVFHGGSPIFPSTPFHEFLVDCDDGELDCEAKKDETVELVLTKHMLYPGSKDIITSKSIKVHLIRKCHDFLP